MKTLNMVFSAPPMFRINPQKWQSNETLNERFISIQENTIKKIKQKCQEILPEFGCKISLLFNAYTEASMSDFFVKQRNYGFDMVYADSGGLQMVTLGKEINRDTMTSIYHTQRNSDIAMSFDEIPAKTIGNKTSLANVESRLFIPSLVEQCATKTANNIVEQCKYLLEYDRPKVLFITQGNNLEDVVEWAERGISIIPQDLWDAKVGGFALGSPCIGSGEQESLENMIAYLTIINKYPERDKGFVHLLGYGSVQRLIPSIELFSTHFVKDDAELTFDSTSLSMTYMMGKWTQWDGKAVSVTTDAEARAVFTEVLDFVEDIFVEQFPDFDKNVFVDYLVKHRMSVARTTQVDVWKSDGIEAWAKCFVPAYTLYQVICLWNGFRLKLEADNILIRSANDCQTIDELHKWFYNNRSLFQSKRVLREPTNPVDGFFS